MSNSMGLDPSELKLPTFYRTVVFKISHFIGPSRPYRFFLTYGGRLLLLLLVCIIVVFGVAYIFSPPGDNSVNKTTPLAEAAGLSGIGAIGGNLTNSAGGTPGSESLTSLLSWNAILGNITTLAAENVQSVGSLVTAETVAAILGLFVLGFVMSTGIRSRRQVLVGKFENHIGSDSDAIGKFAGGMSSLLNVELHRLRRLYSEVDDRRAISSIGGRTGPLDYAITVGDSGDLFKNIYSSETTMKIGIIEIPIGAVSGLFSKIFAGPQIVGGFHKDGDLIILSAFMSGPQSRSWRVEGRIGAHVTPRIDTGVKDLSLSAKDRPVVLTTENVENLDGMVRELAYRIFTDLTKGGTAKWQATCAFSEGLRDYRSCLLSKKDQLRNLKNAERRFFEAISEDSTFGLAWHNLGVVYTELENLEASDKAFLKAIKSRPEGWEAYYALALNRFNKILKTNKEAGFDECVVADETALWNVIHPCNQAIALNPKNPHLHMLIGVCYRMLAIEKRRSGEGKEKSDELFRAAAKAHQYAVKRAWRNLCVSQFKAEDTTTARMFDIQKASSTALWDLARTYYSYAACGMKATEIRTLEPIESVLLQALSIDKANADVFFNLGTVSYTGGKFQDAARSFESATQINPTNLKYWLFLALASQRAGDTNMREFAVGKILEFPSWMRRLPESLQKEMSVLPREGRSRDLRMILDFQRDSIQYPGKISDILEKMPENPDEVMNLVNNPPPEFTIPSFREVSEDNSLLHEAAKGSSLAYHLAHHADNPQDITRLYQTALQFFPDGLPETEWSRWAKGIIAYELASLDSDPLKNLKTSYSCFKNNCPLEIKNKKIHPKLIPLMNQGNESYKALRCASEAQHRNPLGFDELLTFGGCLSTARDLKQSLSAFESALLLEPYSVDTLKSLGDCYWIIGTNCQKREEKETFWKQAIRYFEDAREAWKAKEFKEADNNKKAKGTLESKVSLGSPSAADTTLFRILLSLGNLYFGLSEYGKAITTYDRAIYLFGKDPEYTAEVFICALKYADALLHKRDHESCERYLIDEIIYKIDPKAALIMSGQESEPRFSEEVPLQIMSGSFGPAYAGEMLIRGLLLWAYSYAERDVGLDDALKIIRTADGIKKFMKEKLEDTSYQKELENIAREDPDMAEILFGLNQRFLSEIIPSFEAEILDKCGWAYYKKGDLTTANKKISRALSLKSDADYYFHLANVYASLFHEPDKKPINARWALAYCDHALNMAPRPGLVEQVTQLRTQVKTELDKISG